MFNLNKPKSLLLVLVMVVAAAGGAMAAAPSVNTETTDTTYTTEIEDGETQEHNDSTSTVFSWSADSANSKIIVEQDNETLFEATPDHEDEASGTYYYNQTFADDGSDYEGLEIGAGESVELNVTLINDTEADDPDETNISWTYANDEETAFIASEDPETEEEDDGFFSSFSSLNVFAEDDDEDVGTVVSSDETTVTNNTSEVRLDTLDSDLTDAYAASTEDASDGDILWNSQTHVDVEDGEDQYVPVFYQEAGDKDWLDEDEDAYATVSEDGETMTIHNPDELLGEDEESATMDVTTVGDEMLGQNNALSMMTDDYGADKWDVWASSYAATDFNGNPEIVEDELDA